MCEVAALLLENNAPVDGEDAWRETPLMLAARQGKQRIVCG